jgi:general secretion pathway protein G
VNRTNPTFQRGFTLIEIMVVVVIIGILAGIVAPKIFGNVDKASITRAKQDIRGIEAALDMYKLDNFDYPTTDQGLQALVSNPGDVRNWRPGGYLKQLPKDPWGRDYLYLSPGEHGEIDVFTLGKDGRDGGEEANADIGNWSQN